MATGFVFDERYMWHEMGSAAGHMPTSRFIQPEPHVESPESKRRFRNLLEVSGLSKKLVSIEPRMGTPEELLYFHTEGYIEKIKRLSNADGGDAGEITPFNPELIIVPSGFDANVMDPLGRMLNTSKTYRSMTLLLKELVNEICQDRLLMVHEGGYSTVYIPFCGLAVIEALSGIKTEVVDPYLEFYEGLPGQELQSHQDAVIKKCEELSAKVK